MATASNSGDMAGSNSNVPQWKRDLIQRRRQQNKILAGNGAGKFYAGVIGGASSLADGETSSASSGCQQEQCSGAGAGSGLPSFGQVGTAGAASAAGFSLRAQPSGGATVAGGSTVPGGNADHGEFASPVACTMRLEADLSLCSDSEDVVNGGSCGGGGGGVVVVVGGAGSPSKSVDAERKSEGEESEDSRQEGGKRTRTDGLLSCEDSSRNRSVSGGGGRVERDVMLQVSKMKSSKLEGNESVRSRTLSEDAESDSSEELQYGPGIVNRLKSKYLNLTLREMNKSRVTVQRFRRAASLEDLLDCDEEPACEKIARKYTKRNAVNTAKADRYRNASRGNESMKRARSVETLMRYNAQEDSPRSLTTNGTRSAEPTNDHIILIDRTSVKIESRLELDRPKPINKPKRIKPVLAETERPPPDLVKTTMRIFEGSAKKLKPKGEVAAKVATFKTINDTYKAQAQKKIVPRPPLGPKPFVNGNSRSPGSPKKIVLPQKPTAELIEKQDGQEEYHIDGVITDPIVQSVSSVVSKFQQIEKSHSPSPSPEPSYKLKFSPAPSPEPPLSKLKSSSLEISVKSPPVTPVLSPRVTSPRVQSPPSPMKETGRQSLSPIHKLPMPPSPTKEPFRLPLRPTQDKDQAKSPQNEQHIRHLAEQTSVAQEKKEDSKELRAVEDRDQESVDGVSKTISRIALENISKAGTTMQFSFNDKPSTKSYLPGMKQNGEKPVDENSEPKPLDARGKFLAGIPISTGTDADSRLRPEPEKVEEKEEQQQQQQHQQQQILKVDSKPIGAICSLGLIKSATTTTSYPQVGIESKPVRSQKESPSPPQKQIGIIRPLVSTKTQHPQQNLSNRELEKNLINRVKSIEQPTKVVVSLKSADEIQPAKKTNSGTGGGGLWDTKSWNQQNNTMVFNFSNRKDVPDYIENDGLIIRRKREKPKVGDGGIIVLDATLDASTTDDGEWEISGGPPSPCDVSFLNDNVLINGRSNLSKTPRNHKHRIQFDDTATRTFEYPSEASMMEGESSCVDGEISGSADQQQQQQQQSLPISNKTSTSATNMPSLLGGGGLASYTPSKVDLTSEGFELGVTRAVSSSTPSSTAPSSTNSSQEPECEEVDYLKPAQDGGAWGTETTTGDLLY